MDNFQKGKLLKSMGAVLGCLLLSGCAQLGIPDENARAYPALRAFETSPFEAATVMVNGTYKGFSNQVFVADLGDERQAWSSIRDAFEEKNLIRKVDSAWEESGDLHVLFEFQIEDDVHPLHRTVSRMTLTVFPLWKMVRLEAIARCQVGKKWLPNFHFEEEVLVFDSLFTLPVRLFMERDPVKHLFQEAGHGLTTHVMKEIRRRHLLEDRGRKEQAR